MSLRHLWYASQSPSDAGHISTRETGPGHVAIYSGQRGLSTQHIHDCWESNFRLSLGRGDIDVSVGFDGTATGLGGLLHHPTSTENFASSVPKEHIVEGLKDHREDSSGTQISCVVNSSLISLQALLTWCDMQSSAILVRTAVASH